MLLQLVRAGFGALAVGALGKGLDFSTDGSEHEFVTYLAFYGAGALFVLLVIVATIAIERRKHRAPAAPTGPTAIQLRGGGGAYLHDLEFEGFETAISAERHEGLHAERIRAEREEAPAAQLSFGRPHIPEHPQPIFLSTPIGEQHRIANGRVIQVPVTNAQGAGEAKNVHARLRFVDMQGKTEDRMFAPQETEAEWFGHHGPEVEIDLPGSGRQRLIDVVVVLNWDYPHAYVWTNRSRAAMLHGYGIKAVPFRVEVTVMGSNPGAVLQDTLEVECRPRSMIKADWIGPSRNPEQGDTWVPWSYPRGR